MELEEQLQLIQGLSTILGEYIEFNHKEQNDLLVPDIENILGVVTDLSFDYLDKVTEVG